jgi:hypothetical protein
MFFAGNGLCEAQVLATAVTSGKGAQSITIAGTRLYDDGVGLNVPYVVYTRGITSRFDVYSAVGETNIFGQDQAWVAIGENANLFSVRNYSVSFFSFGSVPLHRFRESSTLFLNAAVILSRPITSKVSVYSGANSFFPIGAKDRGPFTPSTNKFNVPAGASITFGNWNVAAEFDFGKMKAVGIGLSKSF